MFLDTSADKSYKLNDHLKKTGQNQEKSSNACLVILQKDNSIRHKEIISFNNVITLMMPMLLKLYKQAFVVLNLLISTRSTIQNMMMSVHVSGDYKHDYN